MLVEVEGYDVERCCEVAAAIADMMGMVLMPALRDDTGSGPLAGLGQVLMAKNTRLWAAASPDPHAAFVSGAGLITLATLAAPKMADYDTVQELMKLVLFLPVAPPDVVVVLDDEGEICDLFEQLEAAEGWEGCVIYAANMDMSEIIQALRGGYH